MVFGSSVGAHDDVENARRLLSKKYDALQLGFQLNRLRDSARSLVRLPWVRVRIESIVELLLKHGCLAGEEISTLLERKHASAL